MLNLTKKTEYAMIALVYLTSTGKQCSSREIALSHHLSVPLMANILKDMSKNGLVTSIRGTRGGYSMGASADSITMKRVVTLMDGPVTITECGSGKLCEAGDTCPLKSAITDLTAKMSDWLENVTVASLAGRGATDA